MQKKYQNYIKRYAICAAVVSLPVFLNLILVFNAFENMNYKRIVERQQRVKAIYGPALNHNPFNYKLELYKYKKPDLIVLGSSRVIQLREQFFTTSFANCGMGMNHLNEGLIFLEEIVKVHRPQMILLGLDFWWFNAANFQPETFPAHSYNGTGNLLSKIRTPFNWFKRKKISLKHYFNIIFFNNTISEVTKYENMGIFGIRFSEGFRVDGSYINSSIIFGLSRNDEEYHFKRTLSVIQTGGIRFEYGDRVSPGRLQQFHKVLDFCREKNIPLVVFLPPIAPTIYQKMQSMPKEYAFITELRNYLRTLPLEFYDFHDVSAVSNLDCEFFDGFHCGDVLYQKILLAMVKKNPHSALTKYLNIPLLEEKSTEFSGHVVTKYHPSMYYRDEVDFLRLGCKK